jgi:hypothetical protein
LDNGSLVLRLLLVSLLLALAAPAAAQVPGAGDRPPGSAVKITKCLIMPPRPFSHHPTGTQIGFINVGPTLLHRITFEVTYASGGTTFGRSVTDIGTFAPQTPVAHQYPLYSDVTYAGQHAVQCRVTAAQ